jgi:hypothetical protein
VRRSLEQRKLLPDEHRVVRPPTDTRIGRNAERLRDLILEMWVRDEQLKVLHTFFMAEPYSSALRDLVQARRLIERVVLLPY